MRAWRVTPEDTLETPDSRLVFGRRDGEPVVLKVIKRPSDEWHSGEILAAFDGAGVVRVREFIDGAVLIDRLSPGHSLAGLALADRDDEATEILASLIGRLRPTHAPRVAVPVIDLAAGFQRYLAGGDPQIPRSLVERAQHVFVELCGSQSQVRLLHGDLHHHNVLSDDDRWVAIDPKGLVGELEYEIGAALRNPSERPELIGSPEVLARRIRRFETVLALNAARVLDWSFAQAVLSAIWFIEDGHAAATDHGCLALAAAIDALR